MTYNTLANIYTKRILLKEYTENTILELVAKFTPDTTDSTDIIRTNIVRFEKIKDSDRFKKLMPVLLPAVENINDLKRYTYKDLKTILNWFEGDKVQKIELEPQELPGVEPQKLPQGDAVGLEIYVAHNYEQAKYLATQHFGRFYPYCVRIKANWNSYRYSYNQTFYFVYDPAKECSDTNHLLVIRPSSKDMSNYIPGTPRWSVSDGKNFDTEWIWERPQNPAANQARVKAIVEEQPKLRTLKELFVPIKHTARELVDIKMGERSPSAFKNLDYYNKSVYISLGKLLYPEDYALIDKDLQNDYINSQDKWENIRTIKGTQEVVAPGFYSLLYPFEIRGEKEESYGQENTLRKLLGLYILLKAAKTNDLSPLINIHKVIAEGTGPAKKRYQYLLERNKEKLFNTTTLYAKENAQKILELRTNPKNPLKNISLSVLDILPPQLQLTYLFGYSFIATIDEFNSFDVDIQKKYIQKWFERGGGYNATATTSSNFQHYRSITAPFIDISVESSNTALNDSTTIEEYTNNHPGFKDVNQEVKDEFVKGLKAFAAKE